MMHYDRKLLRKELISAGRQGVWQYTIGPADREKALGRRDAGKSGMKAECLAYIKKV